MLIGNVGSQSTGRVSARGWTPGLNNTHQHCSSLLAAAVEDFHRKKWGKSTKPSWLGGAPRSSLSQVISYPCCSGAVARELLAVQACQPLLGCQRMGTAYSAACRGSQVSCRNWFYAKACWVSWSEYLATQVNVLAQIFPGYAPAFFRWELFKVLYPSWNLSLGFSW